MLSRSVEIVTKRWLTVIMVIECGIAIILASWFFFQGYGIVSLLSMIGLFAAFTYSAEPIRFKRRGVFSPLLILILYSLPILGGWVLFQQEFTSIIGLFLFGYILMNEGFTLVNMCEDYDEDRKENIITWAHRLGIEKTVKIAVIFSLSGLFCVLSLLLKMNEFSISIRTVVFLPLIGLTSVSIGKASYEVYEILSSDDLKKATKTSGRRLQRWFLITRFPLILSALVILI
jgi:1,4-dihydroxy-2-naphthoate octaprenyltransferase